ncbi:hypothetical protein Bcep22_gp05 [Burkholderia phage Bcep22]|uniref:Uncharacterized protein n=1 Tax=Burkholderia phage Bcep22 TaxID=2883944 RepID=Q6V7T8_9CAUD|nr:hypothetical protein Bcep22_gp05 [Burkholderia phage Bcep22]AAQ54940.1 hypothetical protein Bcep22_gp05 [Burkholderia phage Bcep22]
MNEKLARAVIDAARDFALTGSGFDAMCRAIEAYETQPSDNSRADALTDAQRRTLQSALDLFVSMGHAPGSDHVRTLAGMLATRPVEQHEAAPWRGACEHTTANTACRICRDKHGENYDQRATQPAPSAPLEGTGNGADGFTYATKQATACAACGEHKHTPLRIDWMGGYVCLTCIDRELESRAPRTEVAGVVPKPVDLKARMDWAESILKSLPEHEPTYAIIDLLNDYDPDERDEILHSIRAYADGRATLALFTQYVPPQPPSADAAAAPADERAAFEAIRNAALDEAAAVVADHQRKGREWVPESLWGQSRHRGGESYPRSEVHRHCSG